MTVTVCDTTFESGGITCAATLYRPEPTGQGLPCVVMGHGFSGTRDLGLPAYAERFAEAGLAVLTFDYRHFGDSGGQPRQLLHGRRQQEDYRAAIAYARELPDIDREAIAIWGSSLSAGHVLAVAASDPALAAAIIQVPGLSATGSFLARVLFATAIDALHGWLRRPPFYRPVVGDPGSGAIIADGHAKRIMYTLAGENSTWRNHIALRGMATGAQPRARNVTQPLLVCAADHDRLAPPSAAWRAARHAPRGELRRYPVGHFDAYLDPARGDIINDQLAFLRRHLNGVAGPQE